MLAHHRHSTSKRCAIQPKVRSKYYSPNEQKRTRRPAADLPVRMTSAGGIPSSFYTFPLPEKERPGEHSKHTAIYRESVPNHSLLLVAHWPIEDMDDTASGSWADMKEGVRYQRLPRSRPIPVHSVAAWYSRGMDKGSKMRRDGSASSE